MSGLAGGVELVHAGAEDSPVIRHHGGEHGRHAHHDHHRRDLHLGGLLLEHTEHTSRRLAPVVLLRSRSSTGLRLSRPLPCACRFVQGKKRGGPENGVLLSTSPLLLSLTAFYLVSGSRALNDEDVLLAPAIGALKSQLQVIFVHFDTSRASKTMLSSTVCRTFSYS